MGRGETSSIAPRHARRDSSAGRVLEEEQGAPPTISIGGPAYNQGTFLKETLTSLLNQHLPPLELVVSDNLSTGLVLQEFGDRIHVIPPPHHLDPFEHFNYLVERLQGHWFSLLSSDDVAKSDYVHTLAEGTTRTPDAVRVKDSTCGERFSRESGSPPFGYDHKYAYAELGCTRKVSDMQAAVGVVQLVDRELGLQGVAAQVVNMPPVKPTDAALLVRRV